MNLSSRFATAALAGAMGLSFAAPRPALADGGSSTRNIIFGAAAIGGTLLVINHNKKVHQRFAEYDRRQAESESERNQAQAAYVHEHQAYQNEVALVRDLQREVAYQHSAIHRRDAQVASLRHSLVVAKASRNRQVASLQHSLVIAKYGRGKNTAYVGRVVAPHSKAAVERGGPPEKAVVALRGADSAAPQTVSYGWGSF